MLGARAERVVAGPPECRARVLVGSAPFEADEAPWLVPPVVARVWVAIALQPREFKLLEYLMRHKDQVVTRTMLIENVWDYHFDPQSNIVDVHVSKLRLKIDAGFTRSLLRTIRSAGYMISADA